MRGVRKSRPPGNVAPALQQARSFTQARLALKQELSAAGVSSPTSTARTAFESLDKGAIRLLLFKEQKGLCVYCEKPLPTPGTEGDEARSGQTGLPRIAHWEPIDVDPEKALDWDNLHLSCASKTSCDIVQGKRSLGLPVPNDERYEDQLTYSSLGELNVRGDARAAISGALANAIGTRTSPGILSLNAADLLKARGDVISTIRTEIGQKFRGKRATRQALLKIADGLLALDPLPAFVSVQVDWLKRHAAGR